MEYPMMKIRNIFIILMVLFLGACRPSTATSGPTETKESPVITPTRTFPTATPTASTPTSTPTRIPSTPTSTLSPQDIASSILTELSIYKKQENSQNRL